MMEGNGVGVYGQSFERRFNIYLEENVTVFQVQVYAFLACVHEIKMNTRPEKYMNICSDNQTALKGQQAATTMSPFVSQCQKALNYISTWHIVGVYWVPGHAGV